MLILGTEAGELQFHVGDDYVQEEVHILSADGDELDVICHYFVNIPLTKGRVITWTGETAQFILNNWPYRIDLDNHRIF